MPSLPMFNLLIRAEAKRPVEEWWPNRLAASDVRISRESANAVALPEELEDNEALYSAGGGYVDQYGDRIKVAGLLEWAQNSAHWVARRGLLERAADAAAVLLEVGQEDAVGLALGNAVTLDCLPEGEWLRAVLLLEAAVEYW